MDLTTFRYLLEMVVQHSLETQLLDVVAAYLYSPLDANLHIKSPPDSSPSPSQLIPLTRFLALSYNAPSTA